MQKRAVAPAFFFPLRLKQPPEGAPRRTCCILNNRLLGYFFATREVSKCVCCWFAPWNRALGHAAKPIWRPTWWIGNGEQRESALGVLSQIGGRCWSLILCFCSRRATPRAGLARATSTFPVVQLSFECCAALNFLWDYKKHYNFTILYTWHLKFKTKNLKENF